MFKVSGASNVEGSQLPYMPPTCAATPQLRSRSKNWDGPATNGFELPHDDAVRPSPDAMEGELEADLDHRLMQAVSNGWIAYLAFPL